MVIQEIEKYCSKNMSEKEAIAFWKKCILEDHVFELLVMYLLLDKHSSNWEPFDELSQYYSRGRFLLWIVFKLEV